MKQCGVAMNEDRSEGSIPFLFARREIFTVERGGTTVSNVSSQTNRASEMGPDD